MPLFHPRVIEKHIKHVEPISETNADILTSWAKNLSNSVYDSETQNDGEFIQRILIDVLGYVGSSDGKNWTVAKNQPVGKGNVDAALGKFSTEEIKILAPFELKGAKTKDLDAIMTGRNKSPVQQAWEYAMDAKGAQWVLVSNYREIRLYAVGYGRKDYESFDLSKLTDPQEYARFILLLSSNNLLSGKTQNLLKESEQVDKDITNKLYADYKDLRVKLIRTISDDNPDKEPLQVIRFTQTILDRILFIAFAEDRDGLLPNNTLKQAYETQNDYNPLPVWENFKGLFRAINKGNSKLDIPAYNGGLFADDPELDNLNISDELCEGFKKIGDYDFESDVSVNILGHIFEQSISDLEELKAHAENVKEINKKQSKRKKDGIFYTPAYITRYIVEQAVGGWLNDRREELGFEKLPVLTDGDYDSIKVMQRGKRKGQITYNKKIEKHIQTWENYKEILSNIKVLDPACGSGAFLNEVFDYLKAEGITVNNQLSALKGGQTTVFKWDTHILANNIYGVDLNSESVEITKLSLWLKTANRQEKLTYLEDNIKVGNSLIDDPEIAGDSAFYWNKTFPQILNDGGFDVIVGNPPYGASLNKNEKEFLKLNYKTTEYNYDTYISFFELAYNLAKNNSYIGYITPNTFLVAENSNKIRELLMQKCSLISLLEIFNVFPDAVVEPVVSITKKSQPPADHKIEVINTIRKNIDFSEKIRSAKNTKFELEEIKKSNLTFNYRGSKKAFALSQKIENKAQKLEENYIVTTGIKPYQKGKGKPPQTAVVVKEKPFTSFSQVDSSWQPLIRGTDITRYNTHWSGEFIKYGEWLAEPRITEYFREPKLFIRRTDDNIMTCIDESKSVGVNSVHTINCKNECTLEKLYLLLGLINSKLTNWYFQYKNFHMVGKPLAEIKVIFVERLPIIDVENKHKFCSLVKTILLDFKNLNKLKSKFLLLLQSELKIEKINRKLENWFELEFSEFLKEIEKLIKPEKLSLSQKSEWMEYFEKEKSKALESKNKINQIDREIDQMVYELYELSPEEIELVEQQYS